MTGHADVAVEALPAETIPVCVWEPACGPGAIARVLRRHGRVVYATDFVGYDSPDQDESGWDFPIKRPRRSDIVSRSLFITRVLDA